MNNVTHQYRITCFLRKHSPALKPLLGVCVPSVPCCAHSWFPSSFALTPLRLSWSVVPVCRCLNTPCTRTRAQTATTCRKCFPTLTAATEPQGVLDLSKSWRCERTTPKTSSERGMAWFVYHTYRWTIRFQVCNIHHAHACMDRLLVHGVFDSSRLLSTLDGWSTERAAVPKARKVVPRIRPTKETTPNI